MHSHRAFSALRPESEGELEEAVLAIDYLSAPATRKWISARILTLLTHYYVAHDEVSIADRVAEDWCISLEAYPAWAIFNACRWWMSRDNPNMRTKPLPGDIQQRAHLEMERVRAAKITVARGVSSHSQSAGVPRQDPTPEEIERRRQVAAEVMAMFSAKANVSSHPDA